MGAGRWSGSSGAGAAQAPHAMPPAAAPGVRAAATHTRHHAPLDVPSLSLWGRQVGEPALATIPTTAQPPRRLAAFSARRVVVSASTRPPRGGREGTSRRSRLPCPLRLRLCAFAASETRLSVPRGAGAAPAPQEASPHGQAHADALDSRARRRRSARRVARQRAAQSRHAATERHDEEQRAGVRLNVRRARSCRDRQSARPPCAVGAGSGGERRGRWTCMHR
jgi:hypothetical protein